MIQIKTNGNALDLPSGFSMEIEDSNPIFNDRGSQSLPATVPATRRNIRLLDAPHRIDTGRDPNAPEREAEVIAGAYVRRGRMNITEAGREEGITFNVGFDNSTAYQKWSGKKLSQLSGLPVLDGGRGPDVQDLLDLLFRIYKNPDPKRDPFAVFPLALNKEEFDSESGSGKSELWEMLNVPRKDDIYPPTTVKRVLNDVLTEVKVPEGYMVSPFLRVWKVLDLIFADLGIQHITSPFHDDPELVRLVVLNNAADACCRGEIKIADLMPDCTVQQFMNALWVRFGLVYNIDFSRNTVTLKLIKDIIGTPGGESLEKYAAGHEKITYEEKQYVKLSAATSIEGAEPGCERFEDLVRGRDISTIHMGADVRLWTVYGPENEYRWDGDVNGGWWNDPEPDDPEPDNPDYPEPDDPEDPDRDRDDDYRSTRSAAQAGRTGEVVDGSGGTDEKFLAREFVTGEWFKLDCGNKRTKVSSSSFFNWDPQPEGLSALDLTSDDECVPVAKVRNVHASTLSFEDYCPLYLKGSRHYHSYIKGNDDEDKNDDETPLAFLFAYTVQHKTIGRVTPEGSDGQGLILDDGTRPQVSLLFQFKDGLFNNYWRQYDEILRHGNRSIELKARINKLDLLSLNFLDPYRFKGVRVMLDTLDYTLPAARAVAANLKLRTIQTHGGYDIKAEQNVPEFAAGARHVEWTVLEDTCGRNLDTQETRAEAVRKFIGENNYHPHGSAHDWYCVDERSIMFWHTVKVTRWEDDEPNQIPQGPGDSVTLTYQADIVYAVYEIHDLDESPDTHFQYGYVRPALGEVRVRVDYQVKLYGILVPD